MKYNGIEVKDYRNEYSKKCFRAGLFWLMVGCLALGWLLGAVGL